MKEDTILGLAIPPADDRRVVTLYVHMKPCCCYWPRQSDDVVTRQ